jgi:hypothetical protein
MSKIEYSSKFAGLKNNSGLPFNIKIASQNFTGVYPAPVSYYETNERIPITTSEQIMDIQVSLEGLDSNRYHMPSNYLSQLYDSNLQPINYTGQANYVQLIIQVFLESNNVRFQIQMYNLLTTPIVVPAFTISGLIVLFDAPFTLNF